jgi:hypothetical protein
MKVISGTFNGTGAALRVGLGFIPDFIRIFNQEDGDLARLDWNRNMRALEVVEGILMGEAAGDFQGTALGFGAGVAPYRGGDKFATAQTAYILQDATPDKRAAGTMGTIKTWTLDTAANRTGRFDVGASTTYVGEGSKITVMDQFGQVKSAVILAMSNDGDAADEVTLSEALPSGNVVALSGMYDYLGLPAGIVMPAGFIINATTVINVSGELCCFEAGTFDL